MKRRFIALLLVMIMTMSFLPLQAFAVESETEYSSAEVDGNATDESYTPDIPEVVQVNVQEEPIVTQSPEAPVSETDVADEIGATDTTAATDEDDPENVTDQNDVTVTPGIAQLTIVSADDENPETIVKRYEGEVELTLATSQSLGDIDDEDGEAEDVEDDEDGEEVLADAMGESLEQLDAFSLQTFNNGVGGVGIPNASLAAGGTIRSWTQLNGANTDVI